MVQDVRGVEPDLEFFGFVDAEPLAQRCVEAPPSRPFHRVRAEIPTGSRLRILQHQGLSSIGVNDGQRTEPVVAAVPER